MSTFRGNPLLQGSARGPAVVSDEPISFWGGLHPETGEIIDRRHPLSGVNIAGKVLIVPSGRGSCSASGVLLEAIRNGVAPVAIIVSSADPVVTLGAVLADELYGQNVPVVQIDELDRRRIRDGDMVTIRQNGEVEVRATGSNESLTSSD